MGLKKFMGLFLQTLSTLCMSFTSIISKQLFSKYQMPPTELTYYRGMLLCLVGLAITVNTGNSPIKFQKVTAWKLFIRGLTGTGGFVLSLYGNKYLPVSISTVLFYIFPILTQLLGVICNNEKLKLFDIIGSVLGFIGVYLIALNPLRAANFDKVSKFYYLYPLIAAFFAAAVYVVTKQLSNGAIPYSVPPVYFGLICAVISSLILMGFPRDRSYGSATVYSYLSITLMAGACALSIVGQLLMNLAMKYEEASKIAAIGYLQIVVTYLSDVIYFKEEINWIDIIGSILIVSYHLGIALNKMIK